MKEKVAAIILAAGKGVRMKSDMPKALCELSGRPMVEFLIDAAKDSGVKDIVVIGGYRIELLRKLLTPRKIKIIEQRKLLGSADAVKQAEGYFKNFKGTILVLYADTPLIRPHTIKGLLRQHRNSKATLTLLTAELADPKEYGRISRDRYNEICGIVEHTDIPAGSDIKARYEINVGAYCFDSERLFEGLTHIKKNRIKKEFYLTDILAYFYEQNYLISSYTISDEDESLGINARGDLILAEEIIRRRQIAKLLEEGIIIKDPSNTYIQENVKIGKGTTIYPFVVIESGVCVGRNCRVGPFAHLRSGTVLEDGSEVGNFVEVVRSRIGKYSKAKHHTYLGDTLIGKGVNVGAGTITANYDGKSKNKTIIKDNAFIGSGTTIVAPVKIGKSAVTGAGSVVVKGRDVAANTIVVGVPARPLKKLKGER